jgi:hypothetical protein
MCGELITALKLCIASGSYTFTRASNFNNSPTISTDGASLTSSVFGLKASPQMPIVFPAKDSRDCLHFLNDVVPLVFVHMNDRFQQFKIVIHISGYLNQGFCILREADPTVADPGVKKAGPIRLSYPIPLATFVTSAPTLILGKIWGGMIYYRINSDKCKMSFTILTEFDII